jgi:hypothetical protein
LKFEILEDLKNPSGHEVQLDFGVVIEGDGDILLGLGTLLHSGVIRLLNRQTDNSSTRGITLAKYIFDL